MKKTDPRNWIDSYKWQYEAYPFFTSVYLPAISPSKNKYFISFDNFLNFFDNGHLIAFQPKKPILRAGDMIIGELLQGDGRYLVQLKKVHKLVEREIEFCLSTIKNGKAVEIDSWWPRASKALSLSSYIIFSFDYPLDDFLNNLATLDPKAYGAFMAKVRPSKTSFMDKAGKKLIKLYRRYPRQLKRVHKKFIQEYGWFQNSYKGKFNITEEWLKINLQSIKNHPSFIRDGKFKLRLPRKYNLLVKTVIEAITFRDDKKKLLLLTVELMDKWLNDYCKIHKLRFKEMRWLSVDEVLSGKYGRLATAFNKKKKRIGIATTFGYDNIPAKAWLDALKVQEKVVGIREFKGVVGNPGIKRGRVKVILDAKLENKKFRLGDVLVTSMTRPEFVPLMKKASAFITDEGGITCHAAIIAREMNKPCIIGTKNATRILKDGMMVEVDANKGIVRIFK